MDFCCSLLWMRCVASEVLSCRAFRPFYFANGLKMTSTPPSDTPLNDYTQLGNKCKTNSPLNTKPTPSIATIATDAFLWCLRKAVLLLLTVFRIVDALLDLSLTRDDISTSPPLDGDGGLKDALLRTIIYESTCTSLMVLDWARYCYRTENVLPMIACCDQRCWLMACSVFFDRTSSSSNPYPTSSLKLWTLNYV